MQRASSTSSKATGASAATCHHHQILVVRPSVCVCNGCGCGRNGFAGQVQNHHVRFSFHVHYIRDSKNCCKAAAAGLDTLRCKLCEGCHCGRLPPHYRRARTQDYLACWTRTRQDFSLTCHSVQRARQPLSRLAWVASRWQGTSCSSSFVSKVLGANWKRANNFNSVVIYSPCAPRTGQEVTFEPISNAHARVDYNTLSHRPDNQVSLDMGSTVPIAITIMFTHIFVTCDKFIIMYTCICCVGAAMHYSTTHNIN